MAKKEIIKVAFKRERLELAMEYMGYSYKTLAKVSGVSDTTIRRSAKNGEINQEFAFKIAEQLATTVAFLSGDKKLNTVAKAFKTVNAFLEGAPEALKAEMGTEQAEAADEGKAE